MLPAPAAPLPDLDPGLPAVLEPAHVRPAPAPAAKKQPAKQLKGQASMWQFTRVLQTQAAVGLCLGLRAQLQNLALGLCLGLRVHK